MYVRVPKSGHGYDVEYFPIIPHIITPASFRALSPFYGVLRSDFSPAKRRPPRRRTVAKLDRAIRCAWLSVGELVVRILQIRSASAS